MISDVICSTSEAESMRNPSNVSISLCAYLSRYMVPSHSNIMNKEGNVIDVCAI